MVLAGVAARPANVLREVLQQLAALRVRVPVATAVLGQILSFDRSAGEEGSDLVSKSEINLINNQKKP